METLIMEKSIKLSILFFGVVLAFPALADLALYCHTMNMGPYTGGYTVVAQFDPTGKTKPVKFGIEHRLDSTPHYMDIQETFLASAKFDENNSRLTKIEGDRITLNYKEPFQGNETDYQNGMFYGHGITADGRVFSIPQSNPIVCCTYDQMQEKTRCQPINR
jgi:hypothetical protein